MTTNETNSSTFGPVVYRYTRAQAIEDGVLVDVSDTAREAGIVFPTAVTSTVWEACVTVPKSASWQSETGRLWDVLMLLRHGIARSAGGQQVNFTVGIQNDEQPPQPVRLKALCGPGDFGEPVITIMFPEEH